MEPPNRLQALPSVDAVLKAAEEEGLLDRLTRPLAAQAVRRALARERERLTAPGAGEEPLDDLRHELLQRGLEAVRLARLGGLVPVLNATGVIVHTNLGRAPLSAESLRAVAETASGYSTLEFDLVTGERGSRNDIVRDALVELTGAGDALVTNNNAAAVLLAINTLAAGREVVVSRSELIEIGGSFRLPEVFSRSGARMREVGTTNRTRIDDYEGAVRQQTGCLMKAHWSNYTISGFVDTVSIDELVALGERVGVPVLHDLGSGLLLPGERLNVPGESTVAESVRAGAGVVTMSGDKLMGGPQAGIAVGRRDLISRMRRNPLMRALRPGKLTLAALAATVDAYLEDRAPSDVPVPAMLATEQQTLRQRASALAEAVNAKAGSAATAEPVPLEARAGGGAAPERTIPSYGISLGVPEGAAVAAARLRLGDPPVVALIRDEALIFDLRTVSPGEDGVLAQAIIKAVMTQ